MPCVPSLRQLCFCERARNLQAAKSSVVCCFLFVPINAQVFFNTVQWYAFQLKRVHLNNNFDMNHAPILSNTKLSMKLLLKIPSC
jgi:hypothetical protein